MNPPLLPGETIVQTCLDPLALQPWLQQALPACASGAWLIEELQLAQARRSSSRHRQPHPLTFCVDLALRESAGGRVQRQRYYGKVYREGASAEAAKAAALEAQQPDQPLQPLQPVHLPQLDLLLWAFPADPGLPQLPALLDPGQTRAWWGRAAQGVHTLRHEPERRATLRYTSHDGRELYAKTFRDDRAEMLHRRFSHFWARAQLDAQAPLVAEPLGYRAETRSLWQAAAQGVPLLQLLDPTPATGASLHTPTLLADTVARALAAVHAAPAELAGPLPRDRAHWLQELRRRRKKIARAVPELAPRAEQLAYTLLAASERLPEPPLSLIHGDCHPDQVWMQGARAVLFDFDEFCLGDPMEDLAEFIVKLPGAPGAQALAAALPAAYARHAPQHFDALRLHWHCSLQQLLQASRAFVFQLPGWQAELERRLSRAEALASALRTSTP